MTVRNLTLTTGLLASSVLAIALATAISHAADHQEAPAATALPAADVGDYYAWHAGDQLNLVLTFGPFAAAGTPASYDSNILYGFHFDTTATADGVSDVDIYARFAQDASGNWGIQVSGADASPIEGAVETVLSSGSASVWTGLADDPFFFDLTGFTETLSTGALSFDPSRDAVAGLNITAIAIQLPLSTVAGSVTALQTWSTTSAL